MNRLVASAPGKVILCGEYAVLDGAPAIAMAVDRRAVVTVRPDGRGENTDSALFESVSSACDAGATNASSFVLDTSAFRDANTDNKLGIGSSAALTVALARVLAPDSDLDAVTDYAQRAHREFQGGVGSGLDIAVSVAGGLIEFRMAGFASNAIRWPDDLHFALLWSGVVTNTRERLERLMQLEQAGAKASKAMLADAAIATAAAWRDASAGVSAAHVVNATKDYVEALQGFSVDHGLGIFEAGHETLVRNAMTTTLVYKPCGAGGGDVGIALATSAAELRAFVANAAALGFTPLSMALDAHGVRFHSE